MVHPSRLRRLISDPAYRLRLTQVFALFLNNPDALAYKGLSRLVNYSNRVSERISNRRRVQCSVCGWTGNAFDAIGTFGYIRKNARCPQCGSLERHRAMIDLLAKRQWLNAGGRCLDVGGIPPFRSLFERRKIDYLSISLGDPAMVCMDVERLAFQEGVFDIILDSHVLEYVVDYRRGLRELLRVLKPSGVMILTETYRYGMPQTIEFGGPNPRATFMIRQFGEDLTDSLQDVGFSYERFDYTGRNDASGDYFFICSNP